MKLGLRVLKPSAGRMLRRENLRALLVVGRMKHGRGRLQGFRV